MSTPKRIQFTADIDAPPARVYDLIIGPDSYPIWTAPFAEGSRFEGSWQQGSRIYFLAPSGDGMVAEIVENRLNEFISIRHLGMISNGVEDTESDAVRAWAPAHENYTLLAVGEGTRMVVDQDVSGEWEAYMRETWPKALEVLRELAEAP